jgi:N,N'-diacetyllegionaminate synthase
MEAGHSNIMKTLRIGNKVIGEGNPVFIIAEAGVNHNGSLILAKKLIDVAKASGADAVKFHNFKPEEVVTARARMARYQERNLGQSQSQLEMIRGFALSNQDLMSIEVYCKKKGILFLSTPHGGFASVDLLAKLKVEAFKFGSGDLTNVPVLRYAALLNKPMIISTGMATMKEIHEAVTTIQKTGNKKIVVMQCTTDYPTAPEEVNLRAIQSIAKATDTLVGFSDHTRGAHASVMAVALGACVIEKHFTLDKKMKGPDHKASADPKELAEFVRILREGEHMLGSSKKAPTKSEKQYIPIVRKSVVARKSIRKGEYFTDENLTVKRPGTGLHPRNYFQLLGKQAKRNIPADKLLTQKDL